MDLTGVEPVSEKRSIIASTCLVLDLITRVRYYPRLTSHISTLISYHTDLSIKSVILRPYLHTPHGHIAVYVRSLLIEATWVLKQQVQQSGKKLP